MPFYNSQKFIIELNMAELEKYSNSVKWVNIGKDWE